MPSRKYSAKEEIRFTSPSTPQFASISFRRAWIWSKMPTAGVQGVCPRSIFFNASCKSKYWQTHFVLLTRSMALGDSTMMETPGGHAKAYWEPVSMISTPNLSISNGSAKNELIQSAIKNKLFRLQN